MLTLLKRFFSEEEGQGMAEYGLILALIAVVVIVALTALGGKINDVFTDITDRFDGDATGETPAT